MVYPVSPSPAYHLVSNHEVSVELEVFEFLRGEVFSLIHFKFYLNLFLESDLVHTVTVLIIAAAVFPSFYEYCVPQFFLLLQLCVFFNVSPFSFRLLRELLFNRSVKASHCQLRKLLFIELVHDRVSLFARAALDTLDPSFCAI